MTRKQERINERLSFEREWQEKCHEASLILDQKERTQKHPQRLRPDSLRDAVNAERLSRHRR